MGTHSRLVAIFEKRTIWSATVRIQRYSRRFCDRRLSGCPFRGSCSLQFCLWIPIIGDMAGVQITGNRIGTATTGDDSSILLENGQRLDIDAGFYAISYNWDRLTVISYRGTSADNAANFVTDVLNGDFAGAGQSTNGQAWLSRQASARHCRISSTRLPIKPRGQCGRNRGCLVLRARACSVFRAATNNKG
ncbi:hypothetical protein ABIE33_005724 [Ensifer sp. 4252]